MAETIKIECPNCRKVLEIPQELEEFSCMYCGERMKLAELLRPTEGQTEAEAYLREHLPEAVTRYPDYYRRITRKDFVPTFAVYEQENSPLLRYLDAARLPGTDTMPRICTSLLDSLDQHMMGDKRWKNRMQRSQVVFETKLVLAIFLCPLVRKLKLESAEESATSCISSGWSAIRRSRGIRATTTCWLRASRSADGASSRRRRANTKAGPTTARS